PLLKNRLQGGERVVRVHPDGKPAQTRIHPLARCGDFTLVRVGLDTGRTHQIRVHAAYLGHPLAGDAKYGDREANRRLRALGLRRLFLHAHRLHVPLAEGGIRTFTAPLPADLAALLERLGCPEPLPGSDAAGIGEP
ncbi:MAG: 23S rRNA pseudouridine(955/2504/2580) synthase, partial [Gammaproteobacteria bacterium]